MARRRLIIYCLLAFALILAGAAAFVFTFDANRYRSRIEATLSERLDHPVRVGRIETRLAPEPLVILDDLRIGEPKEGFAFSVARLTLKPKTKRLLRGEFDFHEVVAESPHLLATLDTPLGAGKPPVEDVIQPTSFNIDSLTAVNASWQLKDLRPGRSPRSYDGTGFAVEAGGVTPDGVETLEASGTLSQGDDRAGVRLSGHLEIRSGGWRRAGIALELETDPLGDAFLALLPLPGYKLTGPAALELALRGRAGDGVEISARLEGRRLALRKSGPEDSPWRPGAVDLDATAVAGESAMRLKRFELKAGKAAASGRLTATRHEKGLLLEASLDKASLPLSIVHSGSFAGARRLRLDKAEATTLLAGIELPGFKAAAPASDTPAPGTLAASASGTLAPLQESAEAAGNIPFRLFATVSDLSADEPYLDTRLETTLGPSSLPGFAKRLESEKRDIEGTAGIDLRLHGRLSSIGVDLEADVSDLGFEWKDLLSKQRGHSGRLSVQARRLESGWEISDATALLPPLDIGVKGRVRPGEDPDYNLVLDIAQFDIFKAGKFAPIIRKIGASGGIGGSLRLAPDASSGTFELHHVGLPVPGKLSDLKHLSGTVKLDGKRLEAPQLQALLGESPLDLSLTVEDLSRPRFDIHLECPSMRAYDLIFPNRQAHLRDLVADFVISAEGLHLVDVRTRLDGGTVARVEGTIAPFSNPDTMLTVDAEYGDIDEVLALFQGPKSEKSAAEEKKKDKKGGEVLIDITAEKGRFSTFKFSDAAGLLTIRNKMLTIHPLSFYVDKGYFSGMLFRDASGETSPRLKIAGHFEDFDADTLYSDQLEQQGIITGKLRGDFYLEGIEGKGEFLESSRGTFDVHLDGGVLRKFKVLAKIFSLLNVSQLFNFQLPDTSSRGMPYDRLSTTARLREGVLETDDLYIDSKAMNMTMVGSLNLLDKSLDLIIGVKPLQTVDKIVSNIPIAGWLLTGEEKALITTHFKVTGATDDPKVRPIPISSVSDKAKGIFRRLFDLPGKLVEDVEDILD